MARPRFPLPGVVLLIGALACQAEPAAERSAPRVVFQQPQSSPSDVATAVALGPAGGSPEVIVLGEPRPTQAAPRPAPRAAPAPQVIVRTVYVDAPPETPRETEPIAPSWPADERVEPVATYPEPVYEPSAPADPVYEPVATTWPAPGPTPTTFPVPDQGPNRTQDAIVGAAIGAGIGAVLGGRDGAIRGGIGGGIGGAIGGRNGAILGGVLGGSNRGGVLGGGRGRVPRRGGGCYAEPFSSPTPLLRDVTVDLVSR
ncbi:MAG TPA: hypothetical protein VM737_02700 [Gemmatimonadota bacterium]|nr:hypothetical protein [Gemmatimonadota bacterium]